MAVLISGRGATLLNLLQLSQAGDLQADIVGVVSSNPNAAGLEHAAAFRVPAVAIAKQGETDSEFSPRVFEQCRAWGAELVVMGGFVKRLPIAADFENRVMNVHPSLIPAFCGQGYYGNRVHQAVLDYGCRITGCTVHFVDDEYDHGPVILQRTVEVRDDDTAESLAQRVQQQERIALPEAINLAAAGRLSVHGRRVRIAPKDPPEAPDSEPRSSR